MRKKRSSKIAKVLNITGIILMVLIIAALGLFNAPRIIGYQVYGILSESMEPEYPVGSVIYAKSVDPEDLEVDDVIVFAYSSGSDLVVAHRIYEIDAEEEQFITKGDANDSVDVNPVQYDAVLGKVTICIPYLGNVYQFMQTTEGKLATVTIFVVVFAMWIVADFLKPKEKKVSKKNKKGKNK